MTDDYLILTQPDINKRVAQGILACENDIASYNTEIAMHTAAVAALGDIKWDDSNIKYRWMKRDDLIRDALNAGLDSTAIQNILNLVALDNHNGGIISAQFELGKTTRNYTNYQNILPAGSDRDTAIAAISTPTA